MDFSFSKEQELLGASIEEFCKKEIDPYVNNWVKERVFPRALLKKLSQIGLTGMNIPEELGGSPLDNVSQGVVAEVLGGHEVPTPIFLTIFGFARLLPFIVDEEVRRRAIGKLLRGELVIAGAFTEPGCGSDAAAITTRAERRGDVYVVKGEKTFITGAPVADVFIVSVKTGTSGPPHRNISLLLIETDRKGVEPYELESMASDIKGEFGGVVFDEVEVPASNLIGMENMGFYILMEEFNILRIFVALATLGLAERCLEEAVSYAKQRRAFGQPISKFEAVSFRLAEHWTKIKAAKLLAYYALWLADNKKPYWAEAAAAKWYGCEVAFNAVNDVIQTYGAAGYTKSYSFERIFRGIRGMLIGDGTGDVMKLIISRHLFGREYAP
jgi:alkylation response protein AidB-like acyl-CoA dehydrogenase